MINKDKRIKGGIAIAAGIALFIGGGTYALWSASDSITGGTIVAGDLGITEGDDTDWIDTSKDRKDSSTAIIQHPNKPNEGDSLCGADIKGHEFHDEDPNDPENIDPWNITPGDSVAKVFLLGAWLKGDNLVAKLTASFDSDDLIVNEHTTLDAAVYYTKPAEDAWTLLTTLSKKDISATTESTDITLGYFQAPNQPNGVEDIPLPTLPDGTDGTIYVPGGSICVVVNAQWDDEDAQGKPAGTSTKVNGRDHVGETVIELPEVEFKLEQTRNYAEIAAWVTAHGIGTYNGPFK